MSTPPKDPGSQQQPGTRQQRTPSNVTSRLSGVSTAVVPQPPHVNTQQRLRIHVPDPATTLLLGQRITSAPQFGYTGATLQTAGNVFADIAKDMAIQARGSAVFQTQAFWQQYAERLMELSSKEGVKVFGGDVFIGAGEAALGPTLLDAAGESLALNSPNTLDTVETHLGAKAQAWQNAVTIIGLVQTALFFAMPKKPDDWLKLFETVYSSYRKVESLLPSPPPKQTLTLFGQGGVSLLTDRTLSASASKIKAYAGSGITLTSAQSSTLQGLIGVKCFGLGKATVEAGLYADVKAGRNIGIAAVRGAVKVKAKTVEVGSASPHLAQAATQKVDVNAKETVAIQVGNYRIEVAEAGITIGRTELVHRNKDKERIADDVLKDIIDNGLTPAVTTKAEFKDPLLTIKGDDIVLNANGMKLVVKPDVVTIGEHEGVRLELTRDTLTAGAKGTYIRVGKASQAVGVKGKQIKLG